MTRRRSATRLGDGEGARPREPLVPLAGPPGPSGVAHSEQNFAPGGFA